MRIRKGPLAAGSDGKVVNEAPQYERICKHWPGRCSQPGCPKDFYLHCGICGAMWTRKWNRDPVNGVRRAVYEGGLHFRERDGVEEIMRCRCLAGQRRSPSIGTIPLHEFNEKLEALRARTTVRQGELPMEAR